MKSTCMACVTSVMKKNDAGIDIFDRYGQEYDSWFDGKGRLIFKNELRLLERFNAHLKHPSIEIGSGSGRFAKALSLDFGIEPSKKLRRISIERGFLPIAGRGENIPFDNSVFSSVFIIVTICFSKNPEMILKEAFRVLRDDGVLILGLVLRDSVWGRFYENKKRKGHRFYSHARFYTLDEIENLLDKTGFAIEDMYSTLLSSPVDVKEEEPVHGFVKEAGFTGILAIKKS